MRLLAALFAGVVALAACGGSSSETEATSGEDITSPLGEFLGQPSFGFGGDDEAAQAAFIEEQREREAIVAQCMAEQGFEYTPVDPETYAFFESPDGLEYGSREWVEKYGFGITTQRFSQEEVGPDLVGFDDSFFQDQFEDDPNQQYAESLTDSEREAYYAALYGDQEDFIFDETLSDEELEAQGEDFDFQPSGCEGEAWAEDTNQQFYEEFGDELDDMYERIQADPRIAEAEQEISDCVAEKGLEYTQMEDLYERFESEMSEIDQAVGYPGEDLTEEDFAEMSEEELDAIFNQARILPDDAKEKLAELQAEEIELALAVDDCGGGFANQSNLYLEIQAEYEQQFLDDNADRLADFEG